VNSKNDPSIVLMFITWYQCINVVLMKINVVCSVCQEWRQILNSVRSTYSALCFWCTTL